ncbi:hypothetical protein F66182_5282 [Fusarium sp. NRRL 66182]|nr:hypothetical protein F66182_5282 [Fusarium sp. NRRL 66182]
MELGLGRSSDHPVTTTSFPVFVYQSLVFNPENPRCIPPRRWRKQARSIVVAAHQSCERQFPIEDMRRLWSVSEYQLQPPPAVVAQRISFLDESRRRALGDGADVGQYSLQEHAQLGLKELLSLPPCPGLSDARSGPSNFIIDASKPIWVLRVAFEGVRYIRYLSNAAGRPGSVRISAPGNVPLAKLYITSDHLGVRDIFFQEDESSNHEQPGVWWSVYNVNEQQRLLKVYTDSIKVRALRAVETSTGEAVGLMSRWSLLPPKQEAIWFLDLDDRARGRSLFKVFNCDSPGIFGYSACMLDGDLVDLHCHVLGEDFSFYHAGDGERRHAVWVFLPVEKGERIIEVWRRIRRPRFCRDIPVLRTNKGRVLCLGIHAGALELPVEYERVTLFPESGPHRFWYSLLPDGVDSFAFDGSDLRRRQVEASRVLGDDGPVHSGYRNQGFASTARLENVVEVIPCRSWTPGSTGIVGLILTYSDGHKDSVGQIRLDHLMPPVAVDPTGDMWLGSRAHPVSQWHGSIVEAMRIIPSDGGTIYGGNTSEQGLRWIRVQWRGRLDWLFWYRQSWVSSTEHPVCTNDAAVVLGALAKKLAKEEETRESVSGS